MKDSIETKHPQYEKASKRWELMNDALGDEDDIKAKGTKYLPKTGGMKANDPDDARYKAYKMRARFPELTIQALTAMGGLIFENEPQGASDEVITNAGQNNVEFARDVTRGVSSKGRDILVIDAPVEGGDPFIARYSADAMINWRTNPGRPSDLTLAVFEESVDSDDAGNYGHSKVRQYRRYMRTSGGIELSIWRVVDNEDVLMGDPQILPVDFMPILVPGSIDMTPAVDPIPLLPVARCAIAYYQMSADYRMSLHISGSPTAWVSGNTQEEYDAMTEVGLGAGALLHVGSNPDAKVGFLESAGRAHGDIRQAMADELKQAETYAVRLTQSNDTPESGVAIAKRAASQHASIYTIADSVSIAVTEAQRMRSAWAGLPEPEPFKLDARIDEEYAGEQMINALNAAVNSLNAPQSALFEAIRKAGLSQMTNEEMIAEIETSGGGVIGAR